MRIQLSIPPSVATLTALLEGLVRVNQWLLVNYFIDAPELYSSGVRYRKEGFRRDDWLTAPEVAMLGYGDCEDLAAWRAAELRNAGELDARAIAITGGAHMFHAVVERADGSIEDPSRKLGMK